MAFAIVRAVGNLIIFLISNNEVELALLQGTAGQYLGGIGGKLDVIARRCRVGVYKLCTVNFYAVQLINGGAGFKLAITVIGDRERDLVFTVIVGDAAEVAVSHLTDDVGLFAYGISIKRKGRECNLAVCGICGGTDNSPVCITQFEREFALLQVTRADFNVQRLVGGQSNRNGLGRIGVGKGCDVLGFGHFSFREIAILVALIILGCTVQAASAVIRDLYHDLINGGVVGDARNGTGVLADEVNVIFCGVEYQRIVSAEGGGLILTVDGSGAVAKSRHGGIALTAQGEGEGIRIVPVAAVQHLCHLEQVFGVSRERMCIVGVYKLGFAVGVGIAVSNRGFQLIAFGIQRNRDGGGDSRGIGHTTGGFARLRDGIVVNTRLCVGDFTECGGRSAFGCRCGCAALISGHRGTGFCRKFKGERIITIPGTAGNALAYAQRGRGCTFKGVGEGHICGGYILPVTAVPPIVGGRDFQQFISCFCCVSRNLNLNQILLCAVSNSVRTITRHFGKLVIIDLTIVVVVQRIGDISKGDLTVRIVAGACRVARHGDASVARQFPVLLVHRCRFELEVELTGSQLHWLIFAIPVELRCLNNEFLFLIFKGVGKRGSCRRGLLVIAEHLHHGGGFHRQLTIAIVRDIDSHLVEGAVIRNAGDFVGGDILGDVVLISAGFREGDTSEGNGNRRSGGSAFRRPLYHVFFIAYVIRFSSPCRQRSTRGDSLQLEGKGIAVPPIAALQNLFSPERIIGVVVIRVYRNFLGCIGVGHRNGRGLGRDRARAVTSNARLGIACGQTFFRDGIGAAYGQAHNLGSLAVFQGESIVVLDGTSGCLSAISIGNGVVIRGIGVHARACQRKLHRKVGVSARVQALGDFNHLGNLHAACGIHGQLTVVAKVQHTHVCGKVPLEVNAAVGGICLVLRLIAQLAINGGGQAAFFDALFDVAFAVCHTNAFSNLIRIINVHGYIVGLGKRFIMVVRILMQVVQLIVIGCIRFKISDRLTIFGKQRGILGVIVEAIACCRGKGGSGRADGFFAICRFFGGIKFVGVEADLAVFGICCNIAGKCVIGYIAGRDLAARIALKTNRVDDADGLGIRNHQRRVVILISRNLVIPQGQHTGRDLDLHRIAGTAAATGDSDKDMAQIGCIGVSVAGRAGIFVRKGVGIYGFTVFIGACCDFGLLVNTTGKGNGLKAFDLHIIAQGIIEGHIAAIFRIIANHFRGAGQILSHRLENTVKDLVQPVSVGSRQIVICAGSRVTEAPVLLTGVPHRPLRISVSGLGIVAGDRLHILVCF